MAAGGSNDPPPPPSAKISLGGVVSKGLTGNADVKVLGVKADGSVDESTVLATGSTNDVGVYSTTEFTAPSVYVVEVLAKACTDTDTDTVAGGPSCSYHQDEATAAKQYLPTGFKMRAVVTTAPSDKRVNVTVFSEFAVKAAETAPRGDHNLIYLRGRRSPGCALACGQHLLAGAPVGHLGSR